MLLNIECRVICRFTARNRRRERKQNPEFESSEYYIFCVRIPRWMRGAGKKIYKKKTEIRKNASQPTEFKNKFLRKQKCTQLFPAGNTRFLPFWILVQLIHHARFYRKLHCPVKRRKNYWKNKDKEMRIRAGWLAR